MESTQQKISLPEVLDKAGTPEKSLGVLLQLLENAGPVEHPHLVTAVNREAHKRVEEALGTLMGPLDWRLGQQARASEALGVADGVLVEQAFKYFVICADACLTKQLLEARCANKRSDVQQKQRSLWRNLASYTDALQGAQLRKLSHWVATGGR